MADVIRLEGIEVFAHHGVFPSERRDGQTFVIDVEVEYDMGPAAASDDVADAIDYGALAEAISVDAGQDPVNLLETLCLRLIRVALGFSSAHAVTVTIHKPQAPMPVVVGDSAVSMRRERGEVS
ncbi:dihydroneopterin aldolase [Pontimonas sp.]|nr:dihydroneopterin aldolase [Pontimonas sp.]MDA8901013.1 dihydroneopterin aldolase [Pontimonas sp.]MDA8909612.1 dihydroneopterin aldolase [Pontimonas sp.]